MKNTIDILRVMWDLNTFTSDDLACALDFTRSGANQVLSALEKAKYVYRVKMSHNYVYALTPKAEKAIVRAGPIDPCERVLPLAFLDDGE